MTSRRFQQALMALWALGSWLWPPIERRASYHAPTRCLGTRQQAAGLLPCNPPLLIPPGAFSQVLPAAYPATEAAKRESMAPGPLTESEAEAPRRPTIRGIRSLPDEAASAPVVPPSLPPSEQVSGPRSATRLPPLLASPRGEQIDGGSAWQQADEGQTGGAQTDSADIGHEPLPIGSGPARPLDPPSDSSTSALALSSPPVGAAMAAAARRADEHLRRGYQLAGRGAIYSARAEFLDALQVLTQALDVHSGGPHFSQALSNGMRAIEEAEDFVPTGSRLEADMDLAALIRAHRTPVLKESAAETLLSVTAQQAYHTYAQEQLGVAVGTEATGSKALYGLGKLYSLLARQEPSVVAAERKAMVFHWAALSTHPGNGMAANELAVLLARYGRYDTARNLLRRSAAAAPDATVWHNLAVVHQRMGEAELAQRAQQESRLASPPQGLTRVKWVDVETFADSSRPGTELAGTADRPPAGKAYEGSSPPARLPWPLKSLFTSRSR